MADSEKPEGDTNLPDDSLVACARCGEQVPIKDTGSYGRIGRQCHLCYNAARALSDHFKRRGRKDEWDRMPPQKKRKLIIDNKMGGGVKGQKRDVRIDEQAR